LQPEKLQEKSAKLLRTATEHQTKGLVLCCNIRKIYLESAKFQIYHNSVIDLSFPTCHLILRQFLQCSSFLIPFLRVLRLKNVT